MEKNGRHRGAKPFIDMWAIQYDQEIPFHLVEFLGVIKIPFKYWIISLTIKPHVYAVLTSPAKVI